MEETKPLLTDRDLNIASPYERAGTRDRIWLEGATYSRDLYEANRAKLEARIRDLEEERRWIPVSEVEPVEGKRYLVTNEEQDSVRALWWSQTLAGRIWTSRYKAGETYDTNYLTHYCQLPTPPSK